MIKLFKPLIIFLFIFVFVGCKDDLQHHIAIRQISLGDTVRMVVDQTEQLNPVASPDNITRPYVLTFESENKAIVTVDSLTGLLTATGKGNAWVRVNVYENGQLMRNITSSVVIAVLPYTLHFEENIVKLPLGATTRLEETVTPVKAPYTLIWASADPGIASVSTDGTITAHSEGQTTITVYINEQPDIKETITVYVGVGEFNPGSGIGDIDDGGNW